MAARACKKQQQQKHTSKTLVTGSQPTAVLLSFKTAQSTGQQEFSNTAATSGDPCALAHKLQALVAGQQKGQLVHPAVGCQVQSSNTEVHSLHLVYSKWQPWCPSTRRLLEPVDINWPAPAAPGALDFTLFSQQGDPPLRLAFKYTGEQATAALSQHKQHLEYIKQQHSRFTKLSGDADTGTGNTSQQTPLFRNSSGPWYQQCTLAFSLSGDNAVVQAVELTVPVVSGCTAALDEGRPTQSNTDSRKDALTTGASRTAAAGMATSVASLPTAGSAAAEEPRQISVTHQQQSSPKHSSTEAKGSSVQQHDGGVLAPPESATGGVTPQAPSSAQLQSSSQATKTSQDTSSSSMQHRQRRRSSSQGDDHDASVSSSKQSNTTAQQAPSISKPMQAAEAAVGVADVSNQQQPQGDLIQVPAAAAAGMLPAFPPNGKHYDSSWHAMANGRHGLVNGYSIQLPVLQQLPPTGKFMASKPEGHVGEGQQLQHQHQQHPRADDDAAPAGDDTPTAGSSHSNAPPRALTPVLGSGAADAHHIDSSAIPSRSGATSRASVSEGDMTDDADSLRSMPVHGSWHHANSDTASSSSGYRPHGRGGGSGWGMPAQQGHVSNPGNSSYNSMSRDRQGRRGSYGNLASVSAGQHHKGQQGHRNGAYPGRGYGGGMMPGGAGRGGSVDDMQLLGHQYGGGAGAGGPMYNHPQQQHQQQHQQQRGYGGRGAGNQQPHHSASHHDLASQGGGAGSSPDAGVPPEPAGTTDLERFLIQITPMINVDCVSRPPEEALRALCLEDVWKFYIEPSLYGREVYTLGGSRGPSMSYFVPYLSAMQLFTPALPTDPSTNRLYICDMDGWPRHMHLRYEHFETELPFSRYPLYEQLDILSKRMAPDTAAQPASSEHAAGSSTGSAATAQAGAAPAAPTPAAAADASASNEGAGQGHAGADSTAAGAGRDDAANGKAAAAEAGSSSNSDGSSSSNNSTLAAADPGPGAANAARSEPGSGSATPKAAAVAAAGMGTKAGSLAGAGGSTQEAPPLPAAAPSGSPLRTMRLSELHPASWYAVAWYPVYRIPDAPLITRFLTFHSFAPLVTSIQNALAALAAGQQRPLSVLPLGAVGLKWYNMHGERWLEPLTVEAAGQVSNALREEASSSGSSYARQAAKRQQAHARHMDIQFQAHLSELQATAERLARGHGLRILGPMGAEDCKLKHPDFEFFNQRS